MIKPMINKLVACFLFSLFFLPLAIIGQETKTSKLNEPNKKSGLPVMEALAVRASATDWSEKDLSLQELSDLLWAANGINRPDSGKKTAPSAMNAQDVDIYVFMKDGVYLYEAKSHSLAQVASSDLRSECFPGRPRRPQPSERSGEQPVSPPPPAGSSATPQAQPGIAPVVLLLVSDISRFRAGSDEQKKEWAAIDTGIVSQNISIFCAATGLGTRPKSSMDREKIRSLLQLKETQLPLLNHPVGYKN